MTKTWIILLILFTFSSCSPKLSGKYKFSEFMFLKKTIEFNKNEFYYTKYSDQSSNEGFGKYQISNDTLILNFKDTIREIPKENIAFTSRPDSSLIYVTNINEFAYRLEYIITDKIGNWDKRTNVIIQPNETVKILQEAHRGNNGYKLNCAATSCKSVSFNFPEEGKYVIRYKFIRGPTSLISGRVFRLPIVELNSDSFKLKEYGTESIYKRVLD